jgi:hypothetical protein
VRDSMYDDTAVRITLPMAARTTNTTVNGSTVNMSQGGLVFRTAMVVAWAGAVTDGTHTVVLEDSPDGTAWTPVDPQYLQGTLTAFATASANTVQRQAYTGEKPFLRAKVTSATVTTGGTVGALILLTQGSGSGPVT